MAGKRGRSGSRVPGADHPEGSYKPLPNRLPAVLTPRDKLVHRIHSTEVALGYLRDLVRQANAAMPRVREYEAQLVRDRKRLARLDANATRRAEPANRGQSRRSRRHGPS